MACIIKIYMSLLWDKVSAMQKEKLKVAVFYRGYTPAKNFGGPVVSIRNIIESCGDEIDFYVITLEHDKGSAVRYENIAPGPNRVGRATVYYLNDNQAHYDGFKELLKGIRPDIIYQNSFFGYTFSLPVLKLSKEMAIPLVLAPRGELCDAAYKMGHLKKLLYKRFVLVRYDLSRVIFHLTSEDEYAQTMKNLRLSPENMCYIPAIPTIPGKKYKKPEKLPGEIRLVFLSRIVKNKNLDYALKLLVRMKANAEFDIYGQVEDADYFDRCLALIKNLPSNIKARYRGVAEPGQVHRIFAEHHLLLFPTQTENYGHVIAEAMLSGCPVIISENTPWTDLRDAGAGWALPLEDEDKFLHALNEAANYDAGEYGALLKRCEKYIMSKVELNRLRARYIQMFSEAGRKNKL
ncbi:MAG TPA: hypothetical protein DEQ02_09730 [Ruminococcaceae bacterium]|nr:hypothetical protein [Oscillospiraceae bacterium]